MDLAEAMATIALLEGHLEVLERRVAARSDEVRELKVQLQLRDFQIARLRHALYGDKSERFVPEAPTLPGLALDLAPAEGTAAVPEPTEKRKRRVREHERTVDPSRARARLELDPARVRDEHRHVYPDTRTCRCCGEALVDIGEETHTSVERDPAPFRRVITHRYKMACASCKQGGVLIAPPEDPPASGPGPVGVSLAVDIAVMHYADHLPFHRLAGIFGREGLSIDRSTLSRVAARVAGALTPVVRVMESELLHSDDVMGIDGTGVKVLASPHCDRFTVYVLHGRGSVVFRPLSRATADRILAGFDTFGGVAVADAATVHTGKVSTAIGLRVALCNAHARRNFWDARATDPARTEHVLRFYRRVAFLERSWADLGAEARRREREAVLGPMFDDLKRWALGELASVAPRSPVQQALEYLLGHWEGLTLFLSDGRVPWTNNASERFLRHLAVGRNAWVFRGSYKGLERASVLWSLMQSCRALGIDPRRYLLDTLEALGRTSRAELASLTPRAYAARREVARAAA